MNWIVIIKVLLTNKIFFLQWIEKFKLIVNDLSITEVIEEAQRIYQKTGHLPTFEELRYTISNSDLIKEVKQKTLQLLKDAEATSITDTDVLSCNEILAKEITRQGLEKLTLDVAQNIHKYSFDAVYDKLKNLSLIYKTSPDALGIDIRDLQRTLSMIKFREGEKIPTGIDDLNYALFGGLGVNELFCIMAHSGRGKTAALINLFYGALLNGFDSAYFSLEMGEKDILRRFYRRVTYKTKQELHEDEKKWSNTIERFFKLTKTSGRILYYPTGTIGVFDIEIALDRLRDLYGFEPRLIIVDHIDLLRPPKVGYKVEHYIALKLVTDALRNIASQATRASFNKIKLTQSDVAESYGKIQSSDVVVALCQTEEELANHRMRMTFVKNRDYVPGREVEVYIDWDKMLLCDIAFARANGWIQ
jgi:replicative DNA helicase